MATWGRGHRRPNDAFGPDSPAISSRLTDPALAAKPTLVDWYFRVGGNGPRPSVAVGLAQHPMASPAEVTTVLCAELAHRWRNGDQVRAEEYLDQFPKVFAADENAIDLVYAEYLEREKAGQSPKPEQFVERFPQFAEALRTQIDFHQAIQEPDLRSRECLEAEDSPPLAASDRADQPRAASGLELQGYEILEEIGRGGMGVVFKAHHRQLDRIVAVKMLLEGPFSNPSHARRFLTEAKASARLQHPGIVQIHEVGQHEGRPFLAFEYIDGGTLAEHLRGRPVQPMSAAAIVEALARAVQFAHERSIVHRDLKPSNVMLQRIDSVGSSTPVSDRRPWVAQWDRAGGDEYPDAELLQRYRFKISDFGLAQFVEEHSELAGGATIAGDIMGTAAYMSPEQARGDLRKSSPACDVYSLGAILYELLTGRPPFVGTRPVEVLAQVVADEPVRPSQLVRRMPADLQTICLKCLEKNPHRRYGSALELAQELARFQDNIPIVARRSTKLERSWRWCRRHPATAVSLASIAFLLLSISVVTMVYSFLLKDQLDHTKAAEVAESNARKNAIERLWGSYLAEANAKRNSRQMGQRIQGMAAVEAARKLGDSIELDERRIATMRETAIACLALPDVRVEPSPPISIAPALYLNFDAGRTRYAFRSEQNEIFVRRTGDNQTLAEFKNLGGQPIPVLSSNGRWLMILNDHCRVYSLDQVPAVQVFESTARGWWSFSPDNTKVLGANGEGELALIEFSTGRVVRSYGPTVALRHPAISPDQSHAAIVSEQAVDVLDLKTGVFVQHFDRPFITDHSQPCAWHPNGSILAVGPYESEGVVLWDVETGEKLDSVNMWGGSFTPYFNATGGLLMGYANWAARLYVWNLETREMEFAEVNFAATDPRADANGGFSFLAYAGDHFLNAFIETSAVLKSLPTPRDRQATRTNSDIVYSRDGKYLARGLNGQVFLYDTRSFQLLDRVLTGTEWGFIEFDAQGSLLTLADTGLVRWPISPRERQSMREPSLGNPTVSFGPPERMVAAASEIKIAVSRDGRQFSVPTADGVQVYRDDALHQPLFLGPHPDVRSISFSADGRMLATGGWASGTARIWSLETGQCIKTLDEPISCLVTFSPDGQYLVTNSDRVRIWNAKTWDLLSTVEVYGASSSGVNVCFSPDSQFLAVSDAMAHIHLVDPATGKIITTLTNPHQAGTNAMAFDPTGDRLAIASGVSAYVWDLGRIQESLVLADLGWPSSEKSLSVQHPQRVAPGNSKDVASDDSQVGAREKTIESDSGAEPSAEFVLDEHFRQLAIAEEIRRAQLAIERGELEFAKYLLTQAAANDPTTSDNCNNLAWVLATGPSTVRDATTAERMSRRAVDLESTEPTFHNTLGVALYRNGKFSDAIATLEKSLAQNDVANQPYDLLFLAMCYAQLNDRPKAIECQDRALQIIADHSQGQSKLWHDELREFEKESRATLETCESRPRDPQADRE